MDLLAGYGSDEEQGSGDEQVLVPPVKLAPVSAAPTHDEPARMYNGHVAPASRPPAEKPKLVAPAHLQVEEEEPSVGPARPTVTRITDEKEIPSISNPEVWDKLPAPKAPARRKVQLMLPQQKALLAAAQAADEDDDKPAKKRPKTAAGGSKLLDFLPAPTNELPRSRAGGGALIDLGDAADAPVMASSKAKPTTEPQQPQVASNEVYRVQPASQTKQKRNAMNDDSDDEDPMLRFGAMPEAGAYASGPIADEGEDVEMIAGPQRYGHGDGDAGGYGMQAGDVQGEGYSYHRPQAPQEGPAHAAAAYYVSNEQGRGDVYEAYSMGQQGMAAAGATEEDPGQVLFAQALAAEQERAAKRGQAFDMSGIQFKEVNAKQLTYMDPAQRAAAQNVRAALGSEFAAALRAEAKPFEGDKMAKRKHQIGTLFYNARMRELEILEGKATSSKTKAETQGKYGW